MEKINLLGQRFGRLLVIEASDIKCGQETAATWLCRCDCGNTIVVRGYLLRRKRSPTHHCGCLKAGMTKTHGHKVGGKVSAEYRAWQSMKTRCYNPNHQYFHLYGGRGITVSEAWRDSFETFYADMGPRPDGMTIERLDSDKPYCKDNCKWATALEQGNNTSRNKRVEYEGETYTVAQLARKLGLRLKNFRYHLDTGKTVEEAASWARAKTWEGNRYTNVRNLKPRHPHS